MVRRDSWKAWRAAIQAEHWLFMVDECTRPEICGVPVSRACVSSEPSCGHPGHVHDQYYWQRHERPLPCSGKYFLPIQAWDNIGRALASLGGQLGRNHDFIGTSVWGFCEWACFPRQGNDHESRGHPPRTCFRRLFGSWLPSYLDEKDIKSSAPSDNVCACTRQGGTTTLETAAQKQVTPGRVPCYFCGRGVLLKSLDWSSKHPVGAVVGVRSRPVLVERVMVCPLGLNRSSRAVCRPATTSCQLVSRCSHHHN